MDMEKTDTLKLSHLVLLQSWVQALPPPLKNVPISQAKRLLRKKPYLTQKFAERLARNLNKGDDWWIAQDADLLMKKMGELPALVPKSPLAKRAFREWQRAIRDHGPLSLEKNLVYYPRTLLPLIESPKITDEEKGIIQMALAFASKGTRRIVKELSKIYKIENDWRLPNGKLMLLGSYFDVGPDDSDEDKNFTTPWIDRIGDTRPQCKEDIAALAAYNRFDLSHEVKKHAPLTRLERQILLLKCKDDITLKKIAKKLGKPLGSIRTTFYTAKRKMDAWLKAIGMKEILQSNDGRTDSLARWLFEPPFKSRRLPQLWNDDLAKTSSPMKAWFDREQDQDFLQSLIPSEDEKPWCW
jgi:DNA-binding CsgD family transcriptional regulator